MVAALIYCVLFKLPHCLGELFRPEEREMMVVAPGGVPSLVSGHAEWGESWRMDGPGKGELWGTRTSGQRSHLL